MDLNQGRLPGGGSEWTLDLRGGRKVNYFLGQLLASVPSVRAVVLSGLFPGLVVIYQRAKHHVNGQKSEQTLGHSEGQGSLVCCSPWSREESDVA